MNGAGIIILLLIGFTILMVFLVVETNQIAKRNYEKLDYIIKLLEETNKDKEPKEDHNIE